MLLILQKVIAFLPYAYRTRTLFWKGTYTYGCTLCPSVFRYFIFYCIYPSAE